MPALDSLPSTPFRVASARTVAELDAAGRVRWQVYSEAMHLAPTLLPALREINGFDVLETTDNFICYRGEEAIGTLRLLRPNPSIAQSQGLALGLPLELQCRFDGLPARSCIAELGRGAILRKHRGSAAIGRLYRAAFEASRRAGITHWIGLSLTETDVLEDARIMVAILRSRGCTSAQPCLHERDASAQGYQPWRPFYSEEDRQRAADGELDRLPLPATVRFKLGIGIRFVGAPIFDHVFKEYMLPAFLALDDFESSAFLKRFSD